MQRLREGDVPGPAREALRAQPQGQGRQRGQERVCAQDLSQVRHKPDGWSAVD